MTSYLRLLLALYKEPNMFIVTWLFDKLGYIPKIDMEVGVVKNWPFPTMEIETLSEPLESPVPEVKKKKPTVRKTTTRKPTVAAKTTRTKKK
jgi:hypothetical protein